ncbi:MAG: class I SAM-dependent methyltransferase [Alphaproteobacteria bacterium]|nr:class I SAM-dependent methyltransferase [Alphaproteobacteria bacterium]
MERRTQETLVGDQFGARAKAYLASAVHAQGADLEALAALVRGKAQARVLDLGCGGGHVSFAVAPQVREVVAYDLSPEMLEVVARAARERGLDNLTTQRGMAERLPFADASFDFVLSRYSAHHWRDLDAGLRETARVLKPGGVAAFADAVAAPAPQIDTYFQAIELLRDPSHVRDYARGEWEAAIARAGLLPTASAAYRVRLVFQTWVERMRTPPAQIDAIRALMAAMPDDVARHLALEADGSFTIDTALFQAAKPAD